MRGERDVAANTFRKIGIGDKGATECDHVGKSLAHDRPGAFRIEAARRDDRTLEILPESCGCDCGRGDTFDQIVRPLDARLDDMEIGRTEDAEPMRDVAKC